MGKDTHITISVYDPDYSRKRFLLGTEEKGGHRTLVIKTQDPQAIEAVTRAVLREQNTITPSRTPRQIEALAPSPQQTIFVPPVTPRKKFLGLF
jgi:ribosome recycling factor